MRTKSVVCVVGFVLIIAFIIAGYLSVSSFSYYESAESVETACYAIAGILLIAMCAWPIIGAVIKVLKLPPKCLEKNSESTREEPKQAITRMRWPRIVAYVSIFFAVVGCIVSLRSAMRYDDSYYYYHYDPDYRLFLIYSSWVAVVISFLAFLGGVSIILGYRLRALIFLLLYSVLAIILIGGTFFAALPVILDNVDEPEWPGIILLATFIAFLKILYPGFVLYWFSRAPIRREFYQWCNKIADSRLESKANEERSLVENVRVEQLKNRPITNIIIILLVIILTILIGYGVFYLSRPH